MKLLALFAVLLLAACGGSSSVPTDFACKGKAMLNGQGQISAMGFGGNNNFMLGFDCGTEGASFHQSKAP